MSCPGTPPARPAAGPRWRGESPANLWFSQWFCKGSQGFRGRCRGGPVGGPREPAFAGTRGMFVFPILFEGFEVTVAGPGAPSDGRPSGSSENQRFPNVFGAPPAARMGRPGLMQFGLPRALQRFACRLICICICKCICICICIYIYVYVYVYVYIYSRRSQRKWPKVCMK